MTIEYFWHGLAMTSNSTPAPYVASASSEYSGTTRAWKAFDLLPNSNWTATSPSNSWLSIDFKEEKFVEVAKVTATTNVSVQPKDFRIEGSNDNSNWNVIGEFNNQTWTAGEEKIFNVEKSNYRYYRLFVITSVNTTNLAVAELNFGYILKKNKILLLSSGEAYNISRGSNTLSKIPSTSIQNFINYGMNSPVQVDGVFESKNYILQDTVSENADGLWVQEINRKPLSIKFE